MKAKAVKCSTREARDYTTDRIVFNSHGALRGDWVAAFDGVDRYVVYSYYAPIYIYDPDMDRWFENSAHHGRSVTTSRHYGQARPRTDDEILTVDGDTFDIIRTRGAAVAMAEQFAGGAA